MPISQRNTSQPVTLDGGILDSRETEIIARVNRTGYPFRADVSLHELIEESVRQHASQVAVICDHDKVFGRPTMSYGELNERVNQLAHTLRERGVGPGEIVGMMVERSFAMILGIFAILKAGAAYLPISPHDPPERTRYFLQNGGVKLVLVQTKTAAKAPPECATLNLDHSESYSGPKDNPQIVAQPRDLAYVIYTSGSTGKPKGVMIEHRSVVNRLAWMQRAYPIGPGDTLLQKTPYCFDVSVWELFWWALEGASLCFLVPGGEKIPMVLVDTVSKHRITMLHFVPSMLNVFLEYLEGKASKVNAGLGSVKRVFCSGEALSPSHVCRFNQVIGCRTGARLTNLYGPTEATVDVTYFDCPAGVEIDRVPIGYPIDNTRIYIVNDGKPVGLGEAGEVCIGGVGLARGYLNNPILTSERFVSAATINGGERIYRTGDLGRWLPDGAVEYLGRQDSQVKIRGLRIELGEIEETLRNCPGVRDCIVTTKKYSESIILIIAYVVCGEGVVTADLKHRLKSFLPDYMVPSHFVRLNSLPLGPTGKADRKALPEPDLSH